MRQPQGNGSCAGQGEGANGEEADAPVVVLGQQTGGDTADEAAERSAADVEAHDEGNLLGRPFLANVGDHDGDDSGNGDTLHGAPEDKLPERCGGGGQQSRQGHAQQRADNDALARQPLCQCAEDRRGNGDAKRGGGDRQADSSLGGVEDLCEQRQQGLRAVKLKEGADAAECDRRGHTTARRDAHLGNRCCG